MYTMGTDGFMSDFSDKSYQNLVNGAVCNRINYLKSLKTFKGGRNQLADEAIDVLRGLLR